MILDIISSHSLHTGEMYSPFLETHPATELPFVLSVGQEVRLNARMVKGSKYDFQVRFITWLLFFLTNLIFRQLLSGLEMKSRQ